MVWESPPRRQSTIRMVPIARSMAPQRLRENPARRLYGIHSQRHQVPRQRENINDYEIHPRPLGRSILRTRDVSVAKERRTRIAQNIYKKYAKRRLPFCRTPSSHLRPICPTSRCRRHRPASRYLQRRNQSTEHQFRRRQARNATSSQQSTHYHK